MAICSCCHGDERGICIVWQLMCGKNECRWLADLWQLQPPIQLIIEPWTRVGVWEGALSPLYRHSQQWTWPLACHRPYSTHRSQATGHDSILPTPYFSTAKYTQSPTKPDTVETVCLNISIYIHKTLHMYMLCMYFYRLFISLHRYISLVRLKSSSTLTYYSILDSHLTHIPTVINVSAYNQSNQDNNSSL